MLGLSEKGANDIFEAAATYSGKDINSTLELEDLARFDDALLEALEAGGSEFITAEKIRRSLNATFAIDLSVEDSEELVRNRDVSGDGILSPEELFPGPLTTGALSKARASSSRLAAGILIPWVYAAWLIVVR